MTTRIEFVALEGTTTVVSRDTAVCTPSVSCSGILIAAFAVSQVSWSTLRCLNTAVYVLKLCLLYWVAINDNAWVYQCLDHVGSSRTCGRYNDCSGHNVVGAMTEQLFINALKTYLPICSCTLLNHVTGSCFLVLFSLFVQPTAPQGRELVPPLLLYSLYCPPLHCTPPCPPALPDGKVQ